MIGKMNIILSVWFQSQERQNLFEIHSYVLRSCLVCNQFVQLFITSLQIYQRLIRDLLYTFFTFQNSLLIRVGNNLYSQETKKRPLNTHTDIHNQRILMNTIDANNPSYYRAHQYKNQFDLPNSALKNRDFQSFPSSIPQGRQYFDPSTKKHFKNKFNRSQIEENNVLWQSSEEQIRQSRIALDSSYFRSLNVDDIQGTRPNTLISKAVKNRQKASDLMKKQETDSRINGLEGMENNLFNFRHNKNQVPNDNYGYSLGIFDKQTQAVNKFKKSKSILQNNSSNILDNFGSKKNLEPQGFQANPKIQLIQERNRANSYNVNFHYKDSPSMIKNNIQNMDTLQSDDEQNQHENKHSMFNKQKTHQIENELISKYHNKNNINQLQRSSDHSSQQNQNFYSNNKFNQNLIPSVHHAILNQPNYETNQQVNRKNQTQISENFKYQDKFNHHSQLISNKQDIIQRNRQIQLPTKNQSPMIDKNNVRKFNPTFLSFESSSLKKFQ